MSFIDRICEAASASRKHIVLAEGEDERVVEAAVEATKRNVARITLLGDRTRLRSRLKTSGVFGQVDVIDPASDDMRAEFAETYMRIRAHKKVDGDDAIRAVSDPLGFAAMMVRAGHADGTIAGAVATTADTIRAALQILGKSSGTKQVSSFFVMADGGTGRPFRREVIFADCALAVEPDAAELADIAIASAMSARQFLSEEPRVALLSFSTSGSSMHPRAEMVREAARLARAQCPELEIEGEIQFDAAIDPAIRKVKAPENGLTDTPNVFVFPNLEAANIGYKIAERIGGMTAVGPILQGLARPANDLSRGCSARDIVALVAITSIQARTIA